jgi:hypothetical protein
MSAEAFAWRGRDVSAGATVLINALMAFAFALNVFVFFRAPAWDKAIMLTWITCMFGLYLIQRSNRRRPALEVRDDEIRYAAGPLGGQRRVPLHEIAEIQIARWRKATLRLRSGKRLAINLKLLEGIDRERAARALERAAGLPQRPIA